MDLSTLTDSPATAGQQQPDPSAETTVQGAARIHAALEKVTHPLRINPS
ncbi:hypothetical protein [Streptacidiphilus sp. PAMC 29251]